MKDTKNLTKIGTSIGVVIPSLWLKNQGLEEGDSVDLDLDDDKVTIRKTKK